MFSLNGTLKKSGSVGRWETKQFIGMTKVEGRRVLSILTIVLSEPTSQNALSSRWRAMNHHKNHISIKPDKFLII